MTPCDFPENDTPKSIFCSKKGTPKMAHPVPAHMVVTPSPDHDRDHGSREGWVGYSPPTFWQQLALLCWQNFEIISTYNQLQNCRAILKNKVFCHCGPLPPFAMFEISRKSRKSLVANRKATFISNQHCNGGRGAKNLIFPQWLNNFATDCNRLKEKLKLEPLIFCGS